MEKKTEFLYNAISDAQELIRFTDTKVAIVITIIAAYIVVFFTAIDKIIKFYTWYSSFFWISALVLIVCLCLCILVIKRIIKPTYNPAKNINVGQTAVPTLKFFIAKNNYFLGNKYFKNPIYAFKNSDKYKLEKSFENYIIEVNKASDNSIIESLTFELLKVNFIRNIKTDRFNILLRLLALTTIAFLISYVTFSIETDYVTHYFKIMHPNWL